MYKSNRNKQIPQSGPVKLIKHGVVVIIDFPQQLIILIRYLPFTQRIFKNSSKNNLKLAMTYKAKKKQPVHVENPQFVGYYRLLYYKI